MCRYAQEVHIHFSSHGLIALLRQHGIPIGQVNTVKQALASEQAKAKEMVLEIEHTKIGTFKTLGTPLTMHGTPSSIRRAPPLLGEHTDQILHEYLDISSGDLDDLKNKKVVA